MGPAGMRTVHHCEWMGPNMVLPNGRWMLSSLLVDELPIAPWKGGAGARIHTDDDKWYIDMFGDSGTVSCGYVEIEHPMHVPQIVPAEVREHTAQMFAQSAGLDWAFFVNSGTEGVETMMKFARRASGRTLIYTHEGEFHGRTYGAMSASFSAPYHRNGYGPFLPGCAMFQDPRDIDNNAAAVIITPAMVNKDFAEYDPEWVARLLTHCRQHDILICLDEVQTFLRLGTVWGHQLYGIQPDMLCTAKGVAMGYPAGIVLGKMSVGLTIAKGGHFSTFGGSPAACALMQVVLSEHGDRKSLTHYRAMGNYMRHRLLSVSNDIRFKGMMVAADLDCDMWRLRNWCLNNGVIIGVFSADQALKLTPPLTITVEELEEAMDVIVEGVRACSS